MIFHRRAFQNLDSNRLQCHQFLLIIQRKARLCHHQFIRTKSDIITSNKQIQHTELSVDHSINEISKNDLISPEKLLPFSAIPCVKQSNNIFTRFTETVNPFGQLISGKWDSHFHEDIDKCHQIHGPIFRKAQLGNNYGIFIKSPELLRDIFTYEGKYPKHPLPEAWTFYNKLHNCQRGLFFMDDEEWLETRRQLAPLMLRNDNRFTNAIEYATDDLIGNWKVIASDRHEFTELPQLITSLYGWSIRVLMGIMFGKIAPIMFQDLRRTIDHFAEVVQNVFEDTVPFATFSPTMARKLHLPIWQKFERSVTDTLHIANEIIDFGLKQSDTDGLLHEMKNLGMTNEMIKRIFIDLIIAAGDTTAFSAQYAMYLLAKNPDQQDLVRSELFEVNAHDTTLIRGTIRETLRLFPVATFIGRFLTNDAILGQYHVDKNNLIIISMWSAGRDEISFPNANKFEPMRWQRDPITGTLKSVNRPRSSIPYAMGARNCIGQRIANAQMNIILSKLLRTFKVQLLNASDIDIVMRLIIMPSVPMRFAVKRID